MVKEWNMKEPGKYAELIKLAEPDFVEVKGYVHVGESQKRLPRESMPDHEEIKNFSEKLSSELGYSLAGEQEKSRVVLLKS